MITRISVILILLTACFASVFPLELSVSISPSPAFITRETDNQPRLRGFEIFSSFEMNIVKLLSVDFNFKYGYLSFSEDFGYPVDYYTYDFFLELKFYPLYFLPIINGIFLSGGVALNLNNYFTNTISFSGSGVSIFIRGGYKWVIFGNKGVFIQPSIEYGYFLIPIVSSVPSLQPLNYYYGYGFELGWVF